MNKKRLIIIIIVVVIVVSYCAYIQIGAHVHYESIETSVNVKSEFSNVF